MKKFSPEQERPEETGGGKVRRWVFVAGNLEIVRYEYEPDTCFPEHSHPEEQVTAVITGSITFHLPGHNVTLKEGEMIYIPCSTPHSATSSGTRKTITLNIFHPPRRSRP